MIFSASITLLAWVRQEALDPLQILAGLYSYIAREAAISLKQYVLTSKICLKLLEIQNANQRKTQGTFLNSGQRVMEF